MPLGIMIATGFWFSIVLAVLPGCLMHWKWVRKQQNPKERFRCGQYIVDSVQTNDACQKPLDFEHFENMLRECGISLHVNLYGCSEP